MSTVRAVRALRGAITVDPGADLDAATRAATRELVAELLARNALAVDDVVSAVFTVTPDLTAARLGEGARSVAGWDAVPMLLVAEGTGDTLLPRCVRVLLHVETERPRDALRHVYLRGAAVLRPDLAADESAG